MTELLYHEHSSVFHHLYLLQKIASIVVLILWQHMMLLNIDLITL